MERFRNRLSIWKRKYLTKRGKLVLIKSTLSSLPVYLLSLFTIPVAISNRIEEIIWNFYGVQQMKLGGIIYCHEIRFACQRNGEVWVYRKSKS